MDKGQYAYDKKKRTLDTSIDFLRDTGTEYSMLKQPLNKLDTLQTMNLEITRSSLVTRMYDQSLLLTKQETFVFPAVLSSAGGQAVCLPLPRPPHQDDHLPLPSQSPLKKSSPPNKGLGAALALKPA